jgi:hypothetical protein
MASRMTYCFSGSCGCVCKDGPKKLPRKPGRLLEVFVLLSDGGWGVLFVDICEIVVLLLLSVGLAVEGRSFVDILLERMIISCEQYERK